MEALFEFIPKEKISGLKFPKEDVLKDKVSIFQRNFDLNRAQALGNLEHCKTKIFFEDSLSKKVVETTVWALTDKRIILKQGTVIPINRIYKSV